MFPLFPSLFLFYRRYSSFRSWDFLDWYWVDLFVYSWLQSFFRTQRVTPYSPWWSCRTQFWICSVSLLDYLTRFSKGFPAVLGRSPSLNPLQSFVWSLSSSSLQGHPASFPWCQSQDTPSMDQNSTPCLTHSAREKASVHYTSHI